MASRTLLTFAVVALVNKLAVETVKSDEMCSVGARLTINIGHNASGHWRTNLRLNKEYPAQYRSNDMKLEVQPTTTIWDGVRSDSLAVVMEGPQIENSSLSNCVSSSFGLRPRHPAAQILLRTYPVPEPVDVPVPEPPPPPRSFGYVKLEGFGYYKVHAEKVTWWAAHGACRTEGAHLLFIDSQEEADAVRQLIREQPRGFSEWMNVGFFSPNSNFVTIFGSPLSLVGYRKWGVYEPDMAVCGHMDQSMLYYDGQCSWTHAFICEYGESPVLSRLLENLPMPPKSIEVTAIPKTPVTTPPSNYTFLMRKGRDHYYKYHAEKVTWWKAKEICESEGAYLVVINTHSEADFLKDFIEEDPSTTTYMHIGVLSAGHFVTIFGEPLSSTGYQRWESEQPDDERCVTVNANMLMFDGPCSYKTGFICEQAIA